MYCQVWKLLDAFNYFQKCKTANFFHQPLIFSRLEPKSSKVFILFLNFGWSKSDVIGRTLNVGKSYVTVNSGTYCVHWLNSRSSTVDLRMLFHRGVFNAFFQKTVIGLLRSDNSLVFINFLQCLSKAVKTSILCPIQSLYAEHQLFPRLQWQCVKPVQGTYKPVLLTNLYCFERY